MNKHPNHLWIMVFLLGFAFDFLFWEQATGINYPIFLTICLLGGFYLLLSNQLKPAKKSLWLLIPFFFFAPMTVLRQEPLTKFLSYVFTLFPLGIFTVTYLGGRWIEYNFADYFSKYFLLLGSLIARPIAFFSQVRKEQAEQGQTRRKIPVKPIVRGLLLALPIVACFAYLLASADLVFADKIAKFFDAFDVGETGEYILRFLIILFFAYLLAGIFLHTSSQSKDEKLLGEDKPLINPSLGFTESAIILGSVTLLFLMFVIVQFQYFFGGNANIGIEGYTYSQYARRGFNELVIVAFLSLLLIMGLSTITKRENDTQKRTYSGLSVAIVLLVMVILSSAYQRLSLAIDWHGFSRLRVYPQVFLVWVGILLIAIVALEIFHLERYFTASVILASFGFAVSLSLFNVDAAIVHRNVLRAIQGKHFNVHHLTSLSVDAIPALADEFLHTSMPVSVKEGVGASLLCHQNSEALTDKPIGDWRSFDISVWQAQRALDNVKTALDGYHANRNVYPMRVRTPGNIVYECATSTDFSGDIDDERSYP